MTDLITIPALLRARAAAEPSGVALLVDGVQALRFADWERRAHQVSGALLQRGLRPGERVGLCFDPAGWIDYAVAYGGVLGAGGAAVHLSGEMPAVEVQRRLDLCDVGLVVSAPGLTYSLPAGDTVGLDELEADPAPPAWGEVRPGDLADILFTSGTTGLAKAVRATHANLMFGQRADGPRPFEGSDHFLGPFPLGTSSSHAMLIFALTGAPVAGVVSRLDPEHVCQVIEQCAVDNVMLAPVTALGLLRASRSRRSALTTVHTLACGSAQLSVPTARALGRLFPSATLVRYYAASEAIPALTTAPFDPDDPTSLGPAAPGTQLCIRDADGVSLPTGEVGDIWLRSAAPQRSYHNDPERDAKTFVDGWTCTGDLGWVDAAGHLHLFDRGADAVVSAGTRVSTLHVEDVLYEHPGVMEAAAVGIPDPLRGAVVAAAVVPRPGADLDDLRPHCERRLSTTEVPVEILLLDSLPRSLMGKVLKRELQPWMVSTLSRQGGSGARSQAPRH